MTVIYLHGFASSPESRKARFFAGRLREAGIACWIADLEGGDFHGLTLSRQLRVVDEMAAGERVSLIGSSLGGYVAALFAARHAETEKLVLLAPAFDFTNLWRERLGEQQLAEWREKGEMEVFHYGAGRPEMIGYSLYADALSYESFPAVAQPTLILHGVRGDVVPVAVAQRFARNTSRARLVTLDSDHELTDQLDNLWLHAARFLGIEPLAIPGLAT